LWEMLPDRLRAEQTLFHATGGIHAAGIFTLDGELLCVREDIGRHNAVDKAIGHFVLRGALPLRDRILVVSGRAGFELVQKALMAAIPAMVSVGAASSVAVDMATAAGMALYSFAGPGRGNLHV
ncbi:MAG: formate dehydrogenase accessory sulfurtransferase FdhD, partial [Acidobacteria bacterium]|nr:formate dehydrogenase accessory sulfurtransferase FdhD [Acidobacteriota bacterium]